MSTHLLVYIICLSVTGTIVFLADWRYPILRDFPVARGIPHRKLPYSLGRVQMALWTVIVVGSFSYVLWVTAGRGAVPVVDPSVVGLLGISGATGILAGYVDVSKDKTVAGARAQFSGTAAAIRALDMQIVSAVTQSPAGALASRLFGEKAARMAEVKGQSQTVERSGRDDKAYGFISDLLTDQNGNSLHRLQLVLFTLIYASYFVWHVASAASPAEALNLQLSSQALGLMGVTGGVYVGFKVPGKSS